MSALDRQHVVLHTQLEGSLRPQTSAKSVAATYKINLMQQFFSYLPRINTVCYQNLITSELGQVQLSLKILGKSAFDVLCNPANNQTVVNKRRLSYNLNGGRNRSK